MKKTKSLISSTGFFLCLTFGLHSQQIERPADTRSAAELEAREISHVEYVAIQEERALRAFDAAEGAAELGNSESTLTPRCLNPNTNTHGGVYHHPYGVSPLGDSVRLEDGSGWSISFSDRYKTLDWMTGDDIVITPHHRWFSSYYYKLSNLMTGVTVLANLAKSPDYNGWATHWICALDKDHRRLCLDDGSVWEISLWDSTLLKKWLVNDSVIIGLEDSWFCTNPNILINASMKETNYVCGKCVEILPVITLPVSP